MNSKSIKLLQAAHDYADQEANHKSDTWTERYWAFIKGAEWSQEKSEPEYMTVSEQIAAAEHVFLSNMKSNELRWELPPGDIEYVVAAEPKFFGTNFGKVASPTPPSEEEDDSAVRVKYQVPVIRELEKVRRELNTRNSHIEWLEEAMDRGEVQLKKDVERLSVELTEALKQVSGLKGANRDLTEELAQARDEFTRLKHDYDFDYNTLSERILEATTRRLDDSNYLIEHWRIEWKLAEGREAKLERLLVDLINDVELYGDGENVLLAGDKARAALEEHRKARESGGAE